LCSVVLHLATAVQKCDFRLVTNLTPTSGDHWTMTCARQDTLLTGRTFCPQGLTADEGP
jgi:hypothetical protein